MPVYNKRGILLLPKVIVLNPKDGKKSRFYAACKVFFYYSTVKLPEMAEVWKCKPVFIDRTYEIR